MEETRFILLLILLFFTNSRKEASTESETKEFLNTLWTLRSFEVDGEIIEPPKNQIYNIQFFADSTMKGRNDCNEIYGYYEVKSNCIKIDSIATTKIGCGEKSMDAIYFEALLLSEYYKIEKNNLTIHYGNNSKLIFIGE